MGKQQGRKLKAARPARIHESTCRIPGMGPGRVWRALGIFASSPSLSTGQGAEGTLTATQKIVI